MLLSACARPLAAAAGLLLVTLSTAWGQTPIGPWSLTCATPANASAVCAADQALSQDGSSITLRVNQLGFTIELALSPQRGSPVEVVFYSASRPAATFPTQQIFFLGRDGDNRRFRLSGNVQAGSALDAMVRASTIPMTVEYSDGTSETFNVNTADVTALFTEMRSVVPF